MKHGINKPLSVCEPFETYTFAEFSSRLGSKFAEFQGLKQFPKAAVCAHGCLQHSAQHYPG